MHVNLEGVATLLIITVKLGSETLQHAAAAQCHSLIAISVNITESSSKIAIPSVIAVAIIVLTSVYWRYLIACACVHIYI